MKKFSQINEAKKEKLEIQDDTMNFIDKTDLEAYLKITDKFISDNTKKLINWLIVNNDSYLHDFDPSGKANNALEVFYNNGTPKNDNLKEVYKLLYTIISQHRFLEIPLFQTKEQFKSIINKKVSPDEIILDLTSERGRTNIVKRFENLIWKYIFNGDGKHKPLKNSIDGKGITNDDLYQAGLEGLTYSMNKFGKPTKRDENGKRVEREKNDKDITSTFAGFAKWNIYHFMLGVIQNESHLVKKSRSFQKSEKEKVGHYVMNNSLSGDQKVGHDSEGNGKTLFDYIDNGENGYKNMDNQELDNLWKIFYKKLEEKFGKEKSDIFCKIMGLNGKEKVKGKDLAKEYNQKSAAGITRIKVMVIDWIMKDKQMKNLFTEILELMHECKQNAYKEEDQFMENQVLNIYDEN